jgi:hypothetical protein
MVWTGEEWQQRYLINLSVDEIEQKYQYWHRVGSCDNTVFTYVRNAAVSNPPRLTAAYLRYGSVPVFAWKHWSA